MEFSSIRVVPSHVLLRPLEGTGRQCAVNIPGYIREDLFLLLQKYFYSRKNPIEKSGRSLGLYIWCIFLTEAPV